MILCELNFLFSGHDLPGSPSSTSASPTLWSISNQSPVQPATAATTASRLMGVITKAVDVFIGQDSRSLDSLFPTFNNSRG